MPSNKPQRKTVFLQALIMLFGLYLTSCGVAFSIKAEIGATPLSCCPAVYSPHRGISVGTGMWGLNMVCLLLEALILRREFTLRHFLQLAMALIQGWMTDLAIFQFRLIEAVVLWQRIVCCGFGILGVASGVFLMVRANLLVIPADGLVTAITAHSRFPFGKVKVCFDCTLVSIATIGSLILNQGKLLQVGFGTLAAALLVGTTVNQIRKIRWLGRALDHLLGTMA